MQDLDQCNCGGSCAKGSIISVQHQMQSGKSCKRLGELREHEKCKVDRCAVTTGPADVRQSGVLLR